MFMFGSRGADGSSASLVYTQILQGMGGGLAAVTVQVGAQASVPHADVGIVTALLLLAAELGAASGTAFGSSFFPCIKSQKLNLFAAGSIWSRMMPAQLEKHLPFLTPERRAELFGSILLAREKPRGDPTREGVILGESQITRFSSHSWRGL